MRSESPTPQAANAAAHAAALPTEWTRSPADPTVQPGESHHAERMKTEADTDSAAAVACPAPQPQAQQMPMQTQEAGMVSWPDVGNRQQAAARPQTCKGSGPAVPPP